MLILIPSPALIRPVLDAGAVPVLDLAAGASAASLPAGCGVRVRKTADAPAGDGPVLAAEGAPLPGRACWLERTDAGPAPAGWAGVYLRGLGSAAPAGFEPVEKLAAAMPAGVAVMLDWPRPPEGPHPANIVVGDVLAGFWPLGAANAARIDRLTAGDLRGPFGVATPLGSPAHRRLAGGEPATKVCGGWIDTDDWTQAPIPGGAGLLHAAGVRRRHGSLAAALRAWLPARVTVATTPAPEQPSVIDLGAHEPIAIVGLGSRLPRSPSPKLLWDNLLAGFDAIGEVPKERWDPALFWDADKSVPDKTYAKIGAFVTDFQFNPRRFRIPPSVAKLIDPVQQMALEAAADAMDDAGYGESRTFDRERVAVILGQSMGGEITDDYTLRIMFPALRKALSEVPGFAALPDRDRASILATYEEAIKGKLPIITEDSMPGELANVVAGRIANALNLGGPNFTTDAACAGSMAAMQAAVKALQDGDVDMALTGGADRSMGIATYTKFCKIGALSPDGSRPFDAGANGFVMGEGVGILVLKRLSDALRDGDRVYAVIRAFGGSSDGKGKGITAPNPEGQKRALRRAYENAGIDPVDVDLFECHGTSTVVGDKVEVEALSEIIGRGRRVGNPARIGSIKSNIGHLKSAAGAASALKAALALHHGVLPPSIHYRTPRKDLDLDVVPLQVQTRPETWERPRFAGVSAFGFGGTNFHMVLESIQRARSATRAPAPVRPAPVVAPPAPVAAPAAPVVVNGKGGVPVPEGIWAASADTPEELIAKLRALRNGRVFPYEPDAPLRIAAAAADKAELDQQVERAIATLQKGKGYDLLRQRGVAIEDVPCDGQLAFLFTGQGSQYIDMGLALAAHYPIVADTFREADDVMTPLLGRTLTSVIRRDPSLTEEAQFDQLRATEISQPATLTVDVAILRLLASFGVRPDVVAGHSLGEYGAAVAAGMLSFRDALVAVSARGREMASVKLDDFGKMAGIATSAETVMEVLAEVPGYVVPANKNCPTQTVIAGETDAVDAAIELFKSRNITVYPLPVSHAFHSRIVAPASGPLKRVLEQLELREPRRRISTNVTSRYYPTGPGAREAAIDILARQVASPVEWTAQIERMYADGARIFVECGPKRALAGFVVSILKHRPHRALYTNQPKRGDVHSFLDALAALFALGFPVGPRAEATADLFADSEPRRSTSQKLAARTKAPIDAPDRGTPAIEIEIRKIVSAKTGYPAEALDLDFDVEADLGIDTVKLADIIATVREHFRLEHDPDFKIGHYRTLRSLVDYAARRIGATAPASMPERRPAHAEPTLPADAAVQFLSEVANKDLRGLDARGFAEAMLPALQGFLRTAWEAFSAAGGGLPALPASPPPAPPIVSTPIVPPAHTVVAATALPRGYHADAIVCSGASLGLPAGTEVFAPDNIQRMLRGENRIIPVDEGTQDQFIDKHLVRLVKDPKTGEGTFLPVTEREQVIRLAGVKAHFDLAADYGVDPALVRSLDITTQLAFAAGLEALRDAGVPLVRTWHTTKSGKAVATGWALPPSMRDGTGIIFGSAFPGYDQLVRHIKSNADDGEGHFDRRFLFQVLAMGHSQFAQFIGARGPNTQVNAACASTTQALAIAEDWLRLGRCDRVIVLGTDDVTNEHLMEWIGAGFMAAGAATTEARVEEAALPFDRRRHGMILGMGAVGLVIERDADVRARGMMPIAELLGTSIANSAFHGTRLDAEHISREVVQFADKVVAAAGVSKAEFARQAVFLSHETYTPARGGSAAAEMASLPAAFGPDASRIVVANTKGYTGHPMGAGVEDTVAVKALQYCQVPPIPNLKEPDPELGELTLSKGGHYDIRYALRLAAGFGSQLALAAWKKVADGDTRVVDARAYDAWLAREGGAGRLVVEHRQLRFVADAVAAPAPAPVPSPGIVPADKGGSPVPAVSAAAVLDTLIGVVAKRTGYDRSEIDPAYELEADLGIDTVKQAEIFSEVRELYGLERDDSFRLADYPTVEKLAGWLSSKAGSAPAPAVAPAPEPVAAPEPAPVAAPTPAPARTGGPSRGEVLEEVLAVVSRRTGYEVAELDPSFELEADLGIDTVKQAEIFGEVRETFGLERDDSFRLADYPTIQKLAGWLHGKAAGRAAPAPVAPVAEPTPPAPEPPPAPTVDASAVPTEPDPELPPSFRIRRPLRVIAPAVLGGSLHGRSVMVGGESPLAEAVRAEVGLRGARLGAHPPEIVIDVALGVSAAFHLARSLDKHPPKQWICVTDAPIDPRAARDDGARAGIAKALAREWSATTSRVVSVDRAPDRLSAATAIVDELLTLDRASEVWVGGSERLANVLEVEPFPGPSLWTDEPVVVLTGGTRGITAQVALEIARRGACTLVLVARTLPGTEPLDEEAEKKRLKTQLGKDGARVTPKMIEDALRPLRTAEEARQTVSRLEALGARVQVYACDLGDADAVLGLVAHLRDTLPRIDLCIHGAGIEESRKLAEKDERAFARIYNPKAVGGLALAEALPATTFFVSMGSVAGRFGNPGQVDYAAANEAMARVCLLRPNALHVCWTAWADVGMAVRGGMETLLTGRGVELLPAEAGARLLCDMVAARMSGEVLVAGKLGDFQSPALHPLLDSVEYEGDVAITRRRLSLESDPWIVDHAIDGTPVLPGVIGLELMVATALSAWPRGVYAGAEDIRFSAPLKLYKDEPTDIEVRAEPDTEGSVRCSLSSTRKTRAGRVIRTEHFEARIELEEMPLLPALPSAFFPEEHVDQAGIYHRFFHGPRFRVLQEVEAVAVQGVLAAAKVDHGGIAAGLRTDPLVLEAVFQAAGLHRMALAGIVALPAAVDSIERVRPAIDGDELTVVVHAREDAYDIDVDGSEGRILRVRGFKLVDFGPLPPEKRLPEPEGGWPSAALATADEAGDELPPTDLASMSARGTPRRIADRLAGQLAARRAVAALVRRASFQVIRRPSGEPVVEGADVHVSVTHHAGEGLAIAVRRARAGIDLEAIEPREPSFARTWFTAAEAARFVSAEDQTAVWAIKEAVLKALGVGMAITPLLIEVDSLSPPAVTLSGEARDRHLELGGAPIRIRAGRLGSRVVATAVFAA